MSRSKSPDLAMEKKPKPRLKSIGSNQYNLSHFPGSGQYSGLSSHTNKNRITSISNIRSTKLLKPKRSLKSFKSPLSKSPSNSIIHTAKEESTEKILTPLTIRTENCRKIEETLKKIQKLDQDSGFLLDSKDLDEKFELFSQIFEEIITKDKQFAKYLLMIKKFNHEYYEQKTAQKSKECEKFQKDLEKSQKDLERLEKEQERLLNSFAQERNSLQRTVETLSRENLQLSRDLEKCEDHIVTLQEQLQIIHTFDSEVLPTNLDNWKCLILENKFYMDQCKGMKKEIEIYKQNQEMFLLKFDELKAQGIEVSYEFSECVSSCSDFSLSQKDFESVLHNQKDFAPVLHKDKSVMNLDLSSLHGSSHLL